MKTQTSKMTWMNRIYKGAGAMILSTFALIGAHFETARADVRAPDEIAQGLADIADSRIRQMAKVVKADPKLEAEMASYRVNVKAVLKDRTLSRDARERKLIELSRKLEPSVKVIFARAGIDERKYRDEGERHIKAMAARKNRSYQAKYLGYLGWYWKLNPMPLRPLKPADEEITLSSPFPLEQRVRNGEGTITVNKEAGTYSAGAQVLFAGGHENSAGLAHFFEVGQSLDEIQAFAALPETQWNLDAFADFLGVFGASAKSRIEIFSNNQVICSEEVEHGNILAPVIYVARKSGSDNIVTNCLIDAPDAGDEIVIRATSVAGVWGGVVGYSNASVTGTPRDLRLLLKH